MAKKFLFGVAILSVVACGGEDEDGAKMAECDGAVPKFSEVRAFDKCVVCHTTGLTDRQSAPENVNFDNYEAASSSADDAAAMVKAGAMPPGGSGITLTAEEKDELETWALCGAPM